MTEQKNATTATVVNDDEREFDRMVDILMAGIAKAI
jgi:hypothetical protein